MAEPRQFVAIMIPHIIGYTMILVYAEHPAFELLKKIRVLQILLLKKFNCIGI